jgi:hypothetical protein
MAVALFNSTPDVNIRLYSGQDFLSNSELACTVTDFVNDAFRYQAEIAAALAIWDLDHIVKHARLDSKDSLAQMLGAEGILAVAYHGEEPVASAGAIPWQPEEDEGVPEGPQGWEIKIVTVKVAYMKQGLAGRCIDVVKERLNRKEKEEKGSEIEILRLWIATPETVNGAYWRRRGFQTVGVFDRPKGYWNSSNGFQKWVGYKDVALDALEEPIIEEKVEVEEAEELHAVKPKLETVKIV